MEFTAFSHENEIECGIINLLKYDVLRHISSFEWNIRVMMIFVGVHFLIIFRFFFVVVVALKKFCWKLDEL